MGRIKAKLHLRGATKPGEMITRMNAMKMKEHSASAIKGMREFVNEESKEKKHGMKHKTVGMKCKSCGMMHKTGGMCYKKSGIKKTGKSFGKSNRLGGGGRFRQVEHAVAGKKGVYNPAGLAAYIGRRSLGKARFQGLAAAGKKRSK